MSPAAVSLVVLAATIVLFVWNRLPPELVAFGSAIALYFTGVLDVEEIFAGFGDQVIIFIVTLFVVSEGLNVTGVTTWAGRQLLVRTGTGRHGLALLGTMLLAAVLSALISVNGAVATLLPMVVLVAVNLRLPPSRLAMPLAFAAHAGSLLTLAGTPVNLIVSEAVVRTGGRPFGFFEFALVGVPLVAGTMGLAVLLSERLLPQRTTPSMSHQLPDDALLDRDHGIAEAVVSPDSALIGDRVFPGMTTVSGDLVVLAVHRKGHDLGQGPFVLAAGDVLWLQGPWDELGRTLRLGRGAWPTLAILAGMVIVLASGTVPPGVAGLLAAGALILLRVVTITEAYDGVSWTTIAVVAGMFPLSAAIQQTGAADQLAHLVVSVVDGNGRLLLLGLFLLTALLGQVISNMATALIVIPIAIAAAGEVGVSVRPVLMCVAVAAAASFLTPIATPANLMVLEPGGYRFGDYWRFGLPMLGWFMLVAVLLVPVFWPL